MQETSPYAEGRRELTLLSLHRTSFKECIYSPVSNYTDINLHGDGDRNRAEVVDSGKYWGEVGNWNECYDWVPLVWHRPQESQTRAQPLGWPLSHWCLG